MNYAQFHNAESQQPAENMPMSEPGTILQHPLLRSIQAQQVQTAVPLQAQAGHCMVSLLSL